MRRVQEQQEIWSDESFAYIEGCTGWGFAYGLTWDELERDADEVSLNASILSQQGWEQTSFVDELSLFDKQDVNELPFNFEEFMRYYATIK
ncbi:hypothetical protein ACX1C1_09615 [Paenibacillus sp. strain BS8-2]